MFASPFNFIRLGQILRQIYRGGGVVVVSFCF